ncbi:LysR family transcriptional regulator [Roseovarius spongiae]|uniref:LysR family transcriptional regulator n=1 Tax=Roseovarius spongiae TaxID=2320272 RepID=A0A3A8AWZ0_9RHOB|nr:LysR substrate-binding domain-containing protein [Roseovarius spongiae]RKF16287.1 LysR family transcriptional regulator [Roseovarius spongiae]
MSTRLPPFKSLEAFEAAGRLGSYKAAAAELNVTPSAISHRISALEKALGETFFAPQGRGTTLTQAGRTYLGAVQRMFDQLRTATDRLKHKGVAGPLGVQVFSTILRGWLIPRLPRFTERHPEVELNLMTPQNPFDHPFQVRDLSVEYLRAPMSGVVCDLLCEDRIHAVCSPAYAARHGPFNSPADLAEATLIHTMYRPDEWAFWQEVVRAEHGHQGRNMRVSTRNAAIDAAAAGLGFALVHWPVAEGLLRSGALVAPLDVPVETGHSFYLVSTPERAALPRVAAFREWMLSEFARDAAGQGDAAGEKRRV